MVIADQKIQNTTQVRNIQFFQCDAILMNVSIF